MASCTINEYSTCYKNKQLSLYTYFLTQAINNPYNIRYGKKSLEEIVKTIKVYENNYQCSHKQTSIFKSNIGGTIYFEVENYEPYQKKEYFEECKNYIIYCIEPSHNGINKKFDVKVILKHLCEKDDIYNYSKEIIKKLEYCEIYNNKKSENYFKNLKTDALSIYFGYDEIDIVNNLYIYTSTNFKLNRLEKNWCIMNDIGIFFRTDYMMLRQHFYNIPVNKDDLIIKIKNIFSEMTIATEQILKNFRMFQNKEIDKQHFLSKVNSYCKKLDALYLEFTNVDIPPIEINDWFKKYEFICNIMSDFSILINNEKLSTNNLVSNINLKIKHYQEGLEKLKKI